MLISATVIQSIKTIPNHCRRCIYGCMAPPFAYLRNYTYETQCPILKQFFNGNRYWASDIFTILVKFAIRLQLDDKS